jgi:3-hydroxyisobutyrate dehydrogenase-like beta-hydroxyacid dehydrogenase
VKAIGIIGLGLVGTALAERLLQAGERVLGFDVATQRRQALSAMGGTAAVAGIDVANQCDVLLLSLPDSRIVAQAVDELVPALRPGQLLVDTSTGRPEDAAALGERLAARGVAFLDATIAGSSVQVAQGDVIAMAGGDAVAFERAAPILATFAKQAFHVGPWGSGAKMKLVVNLVLGLNRAVLAEGLGLAAAMELDLAAALDILQASPAYSTAMDVKGAKMLAGDFAPQARLSQHLKDVRLILAAGERTGAALPLSTVHRQLLEQAEAAGLGELDNSAILRVFRREVQ